MSKLRPSSVGAHGISRTSQICVRRWRTRSEPVSKRNSTSLCLLCCGLDDYLRQEIFTGFQLGEVHELVGLVRLVDGAGAADDGGDARGLEEGRLGSLGN